MSVAAVLRAGVPCTLAVVGPGADGELYESEVLERLGAIGASLVGAIGPPDVARLGTLLDWHRTEASAMVASSAIGERALVAMRRGAHRDV